jgi:hypothetical protein
VASLSAAKNWLQQRQRSAEGTAKKKRKKKVARLVLLHELVKFQVQSTVVFGRLPNQEPQLPTGPTNFT